MPASPFVNAVPIPPVLAPDASGQVTLVAGDATKAFLPGKPAPTYGYNGMDYLGPTVRLQRGQAVRWTVQNQLHPTGSGMVHTNLHPHGLKAAGAVDVFPQGDMGLMTGESASASFTVDQAAATLWYHPHPHGSTGKQVYQGLAGFLLIDDPIAAALPIPKAYGVDDFPILVQDRRFKADGSLDYMDQPQDEDRMLGDQVLVNGALKPYLEVPAGTVRLRLLNGSSARRYRFAFADGRTFHQIASDGGFLEKPAALTELLLGPAERAEILVDLSDLQGRSVLLKSLPFQPEAREGGSAPMGMALDVLELRAMKPGAKLPMPASLMAVSRLDAGTATATRAFHIEDTMHGVINGKVYDPARVDVSISGHPTEVWEVMNMATDIVHPFHVHGLQFQVLSRSTGALVPGEMGWKDTVRVAPGETVRLVLRFTDQEGRYLYHCHILEHEDGVAMGHTMGAMMGQFELH